MLLTQLATFLRSYDGSDPVDVARQSILEWGLSVQTPDDFRTAARLARTNLPCTNGAHAYGLFLSYLDQLSIPARTPVRRGGRQGRLQRLVMARAA